MSRKIMLFGILVLSLCLSTQVSSYNTAKVEGPINISIVPSTNALISLPDNLFLHVEKENTVTIIEQSEFYIANNMNDIIHVSIYRDDDITVNESLGIYFEDHKSQISIMPGDSHKIIFAVEESIESTTAEILFYVEWTNGSAIIRSQAKVEVVEHIDDDDDDEDDYNYLDADTNRTIKDAKELIFKQSNEINEENTLIEETGLMREVDIEEQELDMEEQIIKNQEFEGKIND